MDTAEADDMHATLRQVLAEVRRSTGLELHATVRWLSASELFGNMANEWHDPPDGSWVVDLDGQCTTIQDSGDLADVIEDYVIEEVWGRTGDAPRPGFRRGL